MAKSEFGASWWAQRWLSMLESFGWADRLARGRSYAQYGAVRRLEIVPGEVRATVHGRLAHPLPVRIAVRPLSRAEWERVIAALGAQARYSAHLLAGELPPAIEEAFTAAGVALFPAADELAADCPCPDPANPCKHIAAAYYALGAEFDRDPFLIFRLRGRDRDQILAALREVRVAAAEAPAPPPPEPPPPTNPQPPTPNPPLDAPGVDFWRLAAPLDDFRVTLARPPLEAALLRRLGPPPFWKPPDAFLPLLTAVYAQVTEAALRVALGEGED
jgi:uncharacterized Zn finger protein